MRHCLDMIVLIRFVAGGGLDVVFEVLRNSDLDVAVFAVSL